MLFRKEECASDMGPSSNDAVVKDAQIKLNKGSVYEAWSTCQTMQQCKILHSGANMGTNDTADVDTLSRQRSCLYFKHGAILISTAGTNQHGKI